MANIRRRFIKAIRTFCDGGSQIVSRPEIPAILPEEVAEAREFFPMPKFFIFGHARSGTTLLARLVRAHPEVYCNWQAHFFTQPPLLTSLVSDPETANWLSRRNNRWNRGRDLSPVVLRAAADFILERDARRAGKSVVGDKSPNSALNGESVRLLYNVYPDAKLLFIVRDGRDTVISHRFQSFIDSVESLPPEDLEIRGAYLRDPRPFLRKERSLFTRKGLRRAAENWVRNLTETDAAARSLYDARYLSLRYEDLLADPVEVMDKVWRFLEVSEPSDDLQRAVIEEIQENPDHEWQLQKEQEIAATLQKGRHGSWKEYFTFEDARMFLEVAGEALASWGYEPE
jgi:LPS sulfotransferase NodH